MAQHWMQIHLDNLIQDQTCIWKVKRIIWFNFGTNGFYLDFEKSDLTTSFTDEGHNSLRV